MHTKDTKKVLVLHQLPGIAGELYNSCNPIAIGSCKKIRIQ